MDTNDKLTEVARAGARGGKLPTFDQLSAEQKTLLRDWYDAGVAREDILDAYIKSLPLEEIEDTLNSLGTSGAGDVDHANEGKTFHTSPKKD